MLQSLNLDATTPAIKSRDRTDETLSPTDPAFSGMLALLAGTLQTAPLQAAMPTAAAAPEPRLSANSNRTSALPAERSRNVQTSDQAASGNKTASKAETTEDTASPHRQAGAQPAREESHDAAGTTAQEKSQTATSKVDTAKPESNPELSPKATVAQGASLEQTGADPTTNLDLRAPGSMASATSAASSPVNVQSAATDAKAATPSDAGLAIPQASATKAAAPSPEITPLQATAESAATSNVRADAKVNADPKELVINATAQLAKAPEGAAVAAITGTEAAPAQNHFTFSNAVSGKDAVQALDGISAQKRTTNPTTGEGAVSAVQTLKPQTATASTPTTSTPRPASAFSQVEGTIRWMVRNQENSAELQLHPDKLGRVTISLKMDGQDVHARIWASESSTVPILQEHRASLEQSLREQGLNLGSFDLQSGHRGEDARSDSQERSFSLPTTRSESLDSLQDVPTLATQLLSNAHQIEVFA